MREIVIFLAFCILLNSCANSGYNPSYIISDTASENKELKEDP
jgi:hypothetical protein